MAREKSMVGNHDLKKLALILASILFVVTAITSCAEPMASANGDDWRVEYNPMPDAETWERLNAEGAEYTRICWEIAWHVAGRALDFLDQKQYDHEEEPGIPWSVDENRGFPELGDDENWDWNSTWLRKPDYDSRPWQCIMARNVDLYKLCPELKGITADGMRVDISINRKPSYEEHGDRPACWITFKNPYNRLPGLTLSGEIPYHLTTTINCLSDQYSYGLVGPGFDEDYYGPVLTRDFPAWGEKVDGEIPDAMPERPEECYSWEAKVLFSWEDPIDWEHN